MTQEPPTALPWRTSLTDSTTIIGPDREGVATMLGDYDADDEWPFMEANAALIVRAVNLHADLVLALDQYKSDMLHSPQNDSRERRIAMIDKLLARAKEPQA